MDTERRLARLEASMRRWRRATLFLLVVVLGVLTIAARQDPISDLVRARRIEIVNKDGKSVVALGAIEVGGNGYVYTYGNDGHLSAGVAGGDHGGTIFAGRKGKTTRSGFWVFNKEDHIETGVAMDSQKSTALVSANAKGLTKFEILGPKEARTLAALGTVDSKTGALLICGEEEGQQCILTSNGVNPSSAATSTRSKETTIESSISGSVKKLERGAVFKLANGQIWEQTSFDIAIYFLFAPSVLIYQSGGEWMMKIDGASETISVKRLK